MGFLRFLWPRPGRLVLIVVLLSVDIVTVSCVHPLFGAYAQRVDPDPDYVAEAVAFAEWALPPDATVLAVTSTNWMGTSCSFTAVMPEGSVDGMLRDSHVTAPLERGRTVFEIPADRSRIADGPRTWSAEEVLPRTPARPYPLARKIMIDLSDPGTAVVHVWASG